MMFTCVSCERPVITNQIINFSFQDINDNLCQVCDCCFETINSKLRVEIDFSKLSLLKKRIRMKKKLYVKI